MTDLHQILDQVADAAQSDNKNVKLALATLVLKYSYCAYYTHCL